MCCVCVVCVVCVHVCVNMCMYVSVQVFVCMFKLNKAFIKKHPIYINNIYKEDKDLKV